MQNNIMKQAGHHRSFTRMIRLFRVTIFPMVMASVQINPYPYPGIIFSIQYHMILSGIVSCRILTDGLVNGLRTRGATVHPAREYDHTFISTRLPTTGWCTIDLRGAFVGRTTNSRVSPAHSGPDACRQTEQVAVVAVTNWVLGFSPQDTIK